MIRKRPTSNLKTQQSSSIEDVSEKLVNTDNALNSSPVNVDVIRKAAIECGGLLNRQIRSAAWPKLLGINMYRSSQYTGPPLETHREFKQVKMDVDRSVRRMPPSFTAEETAQTQGRTQSVILRLLQASPELHYYQGLHDVVVTFVIEVGEAAALEVMRVLAANHIRDFMDPDMERTKHLISFLPALLSEVDHQVEDFISRSNCNYYFVLSWLITWFGHEVDSHQDIVRLSDLFLASHPMMPLYVSAAVIMTRREEVLAVECELSEVHGLLVHIPQDLHWEEVIALAVDLFAAHPPKRVAAKKSLSYRRSTAFNCYGRILSQSANQPPDHILQVNPYAGEQSVLLLPWSHRRAAVKLLFVLSPIFLGIVIWWLKLS